jgi:hypothetical protein
MPGSKGHRPGALTPERPRKPSTSSLVLNGGEGPMKCEGCGADLAEGAKTCTACGRATTLGGRAEAGTVHVAEKTGEVAGKVGHGIVGGLKGLGAGAKKGFKGSDEEKKS